MLKFIFGVICIMCSSLALNAGVVKLSNVPDCRDQRFWNKLKSHPQYEQMIKKADEIVSKKPVSPLPLYLEFSRNGNRSNYQDGFFELRHFGALTAAYCTTQDMRYVKNIEERIRIILSLPCWVLPAHDRELDGYYKRSVIVDLFSANLGGELATVLCVLEPVLDKELVAELKQAIFHHVINPFEELIDGKCEKSRFWWLDGTNNWNPVCKRGVITTILRIGMEKERVDRILKLFFDNFEGYLNTFGTSGYCDEGLAYWGGSCGEYLIISALMKQYDGRDILSSEPRMLRAVMYPENIMMAPGYFPAYTDCGINVQPSSFVMQLRDILLGRRKGFRDDLPLPEALDALCLRLNYEADNSPMTVKNDAPYSEFPDGGCFVVRQMPGSPMSVSFKGGHNRESHNHNDVGVYTIALDGIPLVLDPGGEIYTARTFGAGRYESKLLNSYGHSVPRIDGRLQTNMKGSEAQNLPKNITPIEYIKGVLLKYEFSADQGMAKFDISRVYNHISGIEKLERTFEFDRRNNGRFTVSDEAEFSSEMEFENAVVTLGKMEKLGHNKYRVSYKDKSLLLEVKCSVPYKFSMDTINEDTYHKLPVYRYAFTTENKVKNVKMELIYTPGE